MKHHQLLAILLIGGSTACVAVSRPPFLQERPSREWAPTLSRAQSLASLGQSADADSLLARYAADYPGSSGALEADYWRALLNLRTPGPVQSPAFAIPLLQTYVAAGSSTPHFMEAEALLSATSKVDSLSHVTAVYISHGEVVDLPRPDPLKATDAKTATPDARDDEIKRLKDELAKSKDELDRIKKRLAEPPKKPPLV